MKKLILIIVAVTFFGNLPASETLSGTPVIERRAAVDVGSGSTKVTIADVDATNQKIISIVFEDSFPVPYQTSLESSYDGSFDESIRDLGMRTFHQIKEITEDYQVQN